MRPGLVFAIFASIAWSQQEPTIPCLDCHGNGAPGTNLEALRASVHADVACAGCHAGAEERPHDATLPDVYCTSCHEGPSRDYAESVHGKLPPKDAADAPGCKGCHGEHDVYSVKDLRSSASRLSVDETCIACHASPDVTARHKRLPSADFVRRYLESVHGRGVHEKGLTVSATCIDCHGHHGIRAPIDRKSLTHRNRIPETCSKCHLGIYADWEASAHGRLWKAGRQDGPVCTDCHQAHEIEEPRQALFRHEIPKECGGCHEDEALTFADTFHGQATSLGFVVAAKCSDCHTAHRNLPAEDPASSVHPANLTKTCGACHPGANESFVGYQPHIDPDDPTQSTIVHAIALFMKWLLVSVFAAWGLHTLLWFQRSAVALARGEVSREESERWVRRFSGSTIVIHVVIVVSFLGLVATGLPLKYHFASWAQTLGSLWGGIEVARYFHRLFAVATFGYGLYHLGTIAAMSLHRRDLRFILGADSLVPRPKDLADLLDNVRWFLYLGRPPRYGRFAYFEKFDYFAVFWGIPVIGFSGLLLWFPGFFSRFLPGIVFNIAHVVHGEEALLAFGFIFTFHFFHNHLRPENFPLDTVVFTGSMPLSRFMQERPEEYEARMAAGTLEEILVPPPDLATMWRARVFGFASLVAGLLLIGAVFVTYLRGLA